MRQRIPLLGLLFVPALLHCARWAAPPPGTTFTAVGADPSGMLPTLPAPAPTTPVALEPAAPAPHKEGVIAPEEGDKHPTAKPEIVPPKVRLWLGAPTRTGHWTMRIDNDEDHPIRVPADVRLLHIEVDEPDGARVKTYKCDLPAALRPGTVPERRALLLAPGESYAESFDPHLFCFGKNAEALKGGNTVRAYLGWSDKGARPKRGPFAVESTEDPPSFLAIRRLDAPSGILSFDSDRGAMWTQNQWMAPNAPPPPRPPPLPTSTPPIEHNVDHYTAGREARIAAAARNRRRWDQPVNIIYHPEPVKPKQTLTPDEPRRAPIVDENAPRLELSIDRFVDASAPNRVSLTFKATNAGKRPMLVVLRPRMLGLDVEGPDGDKHCEEQSSTGAVARDLFHTMRPGETATMRFLLSEICSNDVFARPGVYKVIAHLDANEPGSELGISAYTGYSTSDLGFIRLSAGSDPFYATAPRAILREKLSDWE